MPSLPSAVCSAPPPSSSGGTRASDIPGFEYVADFIGTMWPDGDTGKLTAAASAWTALADSLDTIKSSDLTRVVDGLDGTDTPEMPSIRGTLSQVQTAVGQLATEARSIATGCTDFAAQIESVHTQTRQELNNLLLQIEATVGVSLLLTVVTAGASDVVGAGVVAGEVTFTVSRILTIIGEAAATVARVVDEVAVAAGSIARIAGISEQVTVRVVAFAGKSVVAGVGNSALNTVSTAITMPGADLNEAALSGFIGGAALGTLGQGVKYGVDAVAARSAMKASLDAALPGISRELGKKVEVLAPIATHVGADGKVIPTRALIHPRASLLEKEYAPQPADGAGVGADSPQVRALLPKGFLRWNGGTKAAYDAEHLSGRIVHGKPEINPNSWPDGEKAPDGFQNPESRMPVVLKKGFIMDRLGGPIGRFTSPVGTSFPPRALHDYSLDYGYHRYEVIHELPAWAGPTADAFGKTGGGPQLLLPEDAKVLLARGFIREVVQ
ncbi:glycohydrolase toxin TNT-related protein [Frondihabitans sp. 4ASC-45]|uniref:glycohydrolase toxin TNT-related protein n=1 Tax=Frondihabitans sp. 4ASC-45 TaxID=3111636 RepID=UPI003C2866AE